MRHRPLRAAILLAAIVAVAGLAYRFLQIDLEAAALVAEARADAVDAARPAAEIAALRVALVSMIAPGQSVASWSQRVSSGIATLRTEAGRLPADGGVQPPGTVSASLDRLAGLERRARAQAMEGPSLLASDVVFSEAAPLLDELASAFEAAATGREQAAAATLAELGRQRQVLAGAGAGVALLAALLLLPLPRGEAAADAPSATADPKGDVQAQAPAVIPVTPCPAPALSTPAPPAAAPPPPATVPTPGVPVGDLARTASVCADLARVSEGAQLTSALARVAGLLNATGLTLWVADVEGRHLHAAAWHGYDAATFETSSPIPREAANLVAAAFRGPATRTTPAVPGCKAAVAVPVPGANGPVGVMSAELSDGVTSVSSTTSALAAIVAAQLATLVSPRAAEDPAGTAERQASRQARG